MRIACCICVVVILLLSRPIRATDAPAPVESFVTAHLAGKVTDADGKALRGVKVFFNRATGAPMDLSPEALRELSALTDVNGRYELTLRPRGGPLVVREVFADLEDFVRGTQMMTSLSIGLRAGDTATVDFVLNPGQVVGGDVRIPLNQAQLAAGVRENEIKHVLLVDGPAFSGLTANARAYTTQPGEYCFEIYLPPGKYSLKVIDSADPLELSDVTRGTRSLVVQPEPVRVDRRRGRCCV